MGKRLRVGYVSPNFRNHVVGRFLLPLLSNHDHVEFEIFCYSDVARPDPVTGQLRACADVWRETADLSDQALADLIRRDRIDILVDLNMHMEGSRLLAFVCKPAPVQTTYLAYAGTTGVTAIDYRLTDIHLDPPGADESIYSERSVRLATSYWCYPPPGEAPAPGPLPAMSAGHVTFGCLNSFWKINAKVLDVWVAILRGVPGSRLILHAPPGSHRDELLRFIAGEAVEPGRIRFEPRASGADYFAIYRGIDIALDPFPYPGGTTTCDALWMGVPVVTLAGTGAIARAGVSILSNVGLPSLIAGSTSQYPRIANELAADLPRLSRLRQSLRKQMARSPLMDGRRFAREMEDAYRRMWSEYLVGAR
jgi:predicted O-linked N-acetylglucosamine transferase (SPINDLY family)